MSLQEVNLKSPGTPASLPPSSQWALSVPPDRALPRRVVAQFLSETERSSKHTECKLLRAHSMQAFEICRNALATAFGSMAHSSHCLHAYWCNIFRAGAGWV
eukprot:1158702-Pelagomonas_calceolata.AAC.4